MLRLITFIALIFPALGHAETLLSAEEFAARVEGKVLTYGLSGEPYGAEEYLPDRRVRWSFLDGECDEGFWYPEGDAICFVYQDTPTPQCWKFFDTGSGIRADFLSDPADDSLYEVDRGEGPLYCTGPEVGV